MNHASRNIIKRKTKEDTVQTQPRRHLSDRPNHNPID